MGVNTVVNCLHRDEFNASLGALSKFGSFVQLTKIDMKNKTELGNGIISFLSNYFV